MTDERQSLPDEMAEAARAFARSLSTEQAGRACLSLDEAGERSRWFYTPTQRNGLPLAEMDAVQQRHAHRLLASGMSKPGYATAATIIGLENILDAKERFRGAGYTGREGPSRGRDPLMYFWTVFGEPGSAEWAWRVEGHHVSVRHLLKDGEIATPAPSFFGADPSQYQTMSGLLRPLGRDEDLGRELLHALNVAQQATALLSPAPPLDIVLGNRPAFEDGALPPPLRSIFSVELEPEAAARFDGYEAQTREQVGLTPTNLDSLRLTSSPKGLPASAMSAPQTDILRALLRQYFDRMPAQIAEDRLKLVDSFGIGQVHFAWAGGLERGQPHYFRVQGPRLLIEYENATAMHAHSVWRDPEGDFGADLLARHHAEAH